MDQLVNECHQNGWKTTVNKQFSNNPFLLKIITDESRADWQYLLELSEESIALDIGAGWGTIAIPVARNIGHVVALDGTLDRLEFLNERAKQENVNNLTLIHADIFNHPLKENQFDLVSYNGVLEWVGVGSQENPKARQIKALEIAFRLLKPGGFLYIGIENATGIKYLLGEPDDHTNIKYISYLEREVADTLSLSITNNEYKTYTYNKQGYREMLDKVGFGDIQFYYPYPDYKLTESFHNLNEPNVSDYLLNSLQFTESADSIKARVFDMEKIIVQNSDLIPFPASYSIFARKE
ncbi:class I SAM-dependent methyltransferase [Paenibacillus illinoisensis]|uniref:class I SAM-dependent methyltransferase n=1 Tax=Paenibacillus illinoisensis TaxID=59845 RepID=UPI003D2BF0C3